MKPLVFMEDIDKSFSGVKALNKCKFELLKGEVHALVGENGAGKSTLMKILTGIYKKNGGRVYYKGKEVTITNPRIALEMGISIIHQELNLIPHLTVAQNIFIGREPSKYGVKFLINDKELNRRAKEMLNLINLNLDPTIKVSDLTVSKQQMVEIAKILSYEAEVIIMDEPTAALTESEIEDLFVTIKHLRDKGVGIIYISHRMNELRKICDRITVMRDGCYINTVKAKEISINKIIEMMVGRTIFESFQMSPVNVNDKVSLSVKNLCRGKELKNISFNLKKGEILGFAGLMGAGRTEVARAIFGADKIESGGIFINGKAIDIKSPSDAVKHGIGYLSEDRKRFGLVVDMTVEENIVLASMKNYFNYIGYINTNKTKETSVKYIDLLKIKTLGSHQLVKNLSGGNQQKLVIAKWLARNCDILIFDEPTRGIDVGAKSEVYKLLNNLAKEGKSIIMISSELPEVLRMSHRVIIMCEGRITGEINIKDANQEKIMKYATQR